MTENLIKAARMYPKSTLALVLFFPVFLNCFGFPILNFTRPRDSLSAVLVFLMTLSVLPSLASMATARFSRYSAVTVLAGLMLLSLAGMGCRLVMEWGEVSIQTDFTPLNILVHLTAMCLLFGFGCWEAAIAQKHK